MAAPGQEAERVIFDSCSVIPIASRCVHAPFSLDRRWLYLGQSTLRPEARAHGVDAATEFQGLLEHLLGDRLPFDRSCARRSAQNVVGDFALPETRVNKAHAIKSADRTR